MFLVGYSIFLSIQILHDKKTNLTLNEELNMADKFHHIEGGRNNSYHLEMSL